MYLNANGAFEARNFFFFGCHGSDYDFFVHEMGIQSNPSELHGLR